MKRFLILISCFFAVTVFASRSFAATILAGDVDFAAGRTAYDVTTNMDHYVFNFQGGVVIGPTNDRGDITWSFTPPSNVGTITSAFLTLSTFDVDPADSLRVYYSVSGGTDVLLGNINELTSSNAYGFSNFNTDVANGVDLSTRPYWTATTLNLSGILSILNTTSLSSV
ncbi:MAG: hypothetical protein OEL83_21010 [Desulforhopalus sp.]|nr:hypothetical protein [Desulforhopalus sp.]